MAKQRQLLTRRGLAARLQVHVNTVDNWTRDGRIPAVHHPLGPGRGRRVLYHLPAVKRALKKAGLMTT